MDSSQKHQLSPIPNFKNSHERPRFYVAHKTASTYVAIATEGTFSFGLSVEDAQSIAKRRQLEGCPWSVDMIVEVIDKPQLGFASDNHWRYHPAFPESAPPVIALDYPDAGSW